MDITGKSVVSSGIYERCFKQDGKLYHHILNPQTGYPYDNGLISVTIISDQSVDGDALSTTCFALGLEDGLKFAEKKACRLYLSQRIMSCIIRTDSGMRSGSLMWNPEP